MRVGDSIEVAVDGVASCTEVWGLEHHRERVSEVSAGEEVGVGVREIDGVAIKGGDELRAIGQAESV